METNLVFSFKKQKFGLGTDLIIEYISYFGALLHLYREEKNSS